MENVKLFALEYRYCFFGNVLYFFTIVLWVLTCLYMLSSLFLKKKKKEIGISPWTTREIPVFSSYFDVNLFSCDLYIVSWVFMKSVVLLLLNIRLSIDVLFVVYRWKFSFQTVQQEWSLAREVIISNRSKKRAVLTFKSPKSQKKQIYLKGVSQWQVSIIVLDVTHVK